MPNASQTGVMARAAEAMLRVLGGTEITLRLMSPAAASDQVSLGMSAPLTEDVAISPVVVTSLEGGNELLLGAATLSAELARRAQTAEEFFSTALGVLLTPDPGPVAAGVEGSPATLLPIRGLVVETFAGSEYLYRVKIGR